MRIRLFAVVLLSLVACGDKFTVGDHDASADGADGAVEDAGGTDAGPFEDTGALPDAAALADAALADAALSDTSDSDAAIHADCAPPWLYYVVQSEDQPTYVARHSITAAGTERCADLAGADGIADLASSALVVDAETMILAGPDSLQRLNLLTDRIEWTIPTDLDFLPLGHIALFDVDATSFGVAWDREAPSLGGVSTRSTTNGAMQRELDVAWNDATAAPERRGDLWIVGRSSLGANVAQRYVVESQSATEEFAVAAERISTVGERLVIATSAGYRLYDLVEDEDPSFVDTVFLPAGECRIIDLVGHPFRDEAVFVGCGAGGNIESVRIHDRDADRYEALPNSLRFDESVRSLALYEGP